MQQHDLDLSTTVAGVRLSSPFFNASGVWCTTSKDLEQVLNSPFTGAVVTKSCTLLPRDGNPKPRYQGIRNQTSSFTGSINSMGLPNKGIDYYLQTARYLAPQKPFFVSVCGLTLTENMHILSAIQHDVVASPLAGVELNLSCPNVVGKPQTGYEFDAMDEMLRQSTEMFDRYALGVKLPPYFDPIHFDMAADVLKRYQNNIRWVTCINSIGNGLIVDPVTEQPVIVPKGGFGGIGGAYVKPTALANVRAFRERLPMHIDIIGCGGIVRGVDAFEHILCGASAVQVGTTIIEHGLGAFQHLHEELVQIMRAKNYSNLSDFRGKLKPPGCGKKN